MNRLEEIVSRFEASFSNPAVLLPAPAEIEECLERIGKVLGRHELLDEMHQVMRAKRLVFSPSHAELLKELLNLVKQEIASDTRKRRAFEYKPNHIPANERWGNFFFAFVLLGYGGLGINIDDLYIPGKRGSGVHLHGAPAWVMFSAICCAAIVLLATIVDHYDRRDNERHYQAAANWFKTAGWGLFAGAFVLDFYLKFAR
jgi:hypothetical protein